MHLDLSILCHKVVYIMQCVAVRYSVSQCGAACCSAL